MQQRRGAGLPAKGTPAALGGSQQKPARKPAPSQGAPVADREAIADGAQAGGSDSDVVPLDPLPHGGGAPAGGTSSPGVETSSRRSVSVGAAPVFLPGGMKVEPFKRACPVDLPVSGEENPKTLPAKAADDSGARPSNISARGAWRVQLGSPDVAIVKAVEDGAQQDVVDPGADVGVTHDARVSGVQSPSVVEARKKTTSVHAFPLAGREAVPKPAVKRLAARRYAMATSFAHEKQGKNALMKVDMKSTAAVNWTLAACMEAMCILVVLLKGHVRSDMVFQNGIQKPGHVVPFWPKPDYAHGRMQNGTNLALSNISREAAPGGARYPVIITNECFFAKEQEECAVEDIGGVSTQGTKLLSLHDAVASGPEVKDKNNGAAGTLGKVAGVFVSYREGTTWTSEMESGRAPQVSTTSFA
eukprot:g11848.t1